MISVTEASRIILENSLEFGEKEVAIKDAVGEILRENLFADRDFPPFNRSTMDGIAIDYTAFASGRRDFKIEAVGAAGSPQCVLQNPEHCIEIMTGAIAPKNTDTVIRYEDVIIKDGIATFQLDELKEGKNIHIEGEDGKKGDILVAAGIKISAAEIGIAATIGKTHLKVADIPKAVIISTGNELVDVNQTPLPYQIRKSNSYQLQAAVKNWGIQADIAHLRDEEDAIFSELKQLLSKYKIIIMSGGVSKGKFDYIPGTLEKLGVKKLFHRVKQRPGKPFWFGVSPEGTRVFALPGNPVSTFMCAHRYVHTWLKASLNLSLDLPYAILEKDYHFKPGLTYYLQVKLRYAQDGRLMAMPITGNGSGDHANLASADAFLELPAGRSDFKKGEVFPVMFYR